MWLEIDLRSLGQVFTNLGFDPIDFQCDLLHQVLAVDTEKLLKCLGGFPDFGVQIFEVVMVNEALGKAVPIKVEPGPNAVGVRSPSPLRFGGRCDRWPGRPREKHADGADDAPDERLTAVPQRVSGIRTGSA